MPALISSSIADLVRTQLERFLVHTCTITPMTLSGVDEEFNDVYVAGAPLTDVPCKYNAEDQVRITETGQTLVSVPTVSFAHDQVIDQHSIVSAIEDSDGNVLMAGPAAVDYITSSAGFGPSLKKRAVLRAGDVR